MGAVIAILGGTMIVIRRTRGEWRRAPIEKSALAHGPCSSSERESQCDNATKGFTTVTLSPIVLADGLSRATVVLRDEDSDSYSYIPDLILF